jgi:hypothetical protein
VARGEDLLWYAESYVRAGKYDEALAALKDDPYVCSQLARQLAERGNAPLAEAARIKARTLFEEKLAKEPEVAKSRSACSMSTRVRWCSHWNPSMTGLGHLVLTRRQQAFHRIQPRQRRRMGGAPMSRRCHDNCR